MNIISKGWNYLSNFSKAAGVFEASSAASAILFEGSGPAAAALTAAGTPVAVGSAVAVATMLLEAALVFTAITACALVPGLIINYLHNNYNQETASSETDCGTKLSDTPSNFSALELPKYEVEATGLNFAPEAA